jgi:hypothetical protein
MSVNRGSRLNWVHACFQLRWSCRRKKIVPAGKHLRGVSKKEQRQYEHTKESAEKSGRYGKRAKEVAARTVLKEHKEKGHAKGK